MGTARMKLDKETDEEGKNRGLSMEKTKAGTKKGSPDDLLLSNQNITIINIICQYFIRYEKKLNEIQLTKKQNGLEQSKNENSSILPN